jgi:hypothetical protein
VGASLVLSSVPIDPLVVPLLLFGLALVLRRFAPDKVAGADLAAGTETRTCADVKAGAAASDQEGVYREPIELKGEVAPASPVLTAPLSGQPCVWYRTRVTHRFWGPVPRVNDTGGTYEGRGACQRVISSEGSGAPLTIDDGTGRLSIDPRGANVDGAEPSFDRFEPEGGGTFSPWLSRLLRLDYHELGFLTADGEADSVSPANSIGYRREECILRPDSSLYVLGEVTDAPGALQVVKPEQAGELLISSRSEEQLISDARKRSYAMRGAAVSAVVGAAIVLPAVVTALW